MELLTRGEAHYARRAEQEAALRKQKEEGMQVGGGGFPDTGGGDGGGDDAPVDAAAAAAAEAALFAKGCIDMSGEDANLRFVLLTGNHVTTPVWEPIRRFLKETKSLLLMEF